MSITVTVNVNTQATIKAGKPRTGPATIALTDEILANWLPSERDALAARIATKFGDDRNTGRREWLEVCELGLNACNNGTYRSRTITVDDPTPVGLLAAIHANADAIAEECDERAEKEYALDREAIADALARKVKPLSKCASVCRNTDGSVHQRLNASISMKGWHYAEVTGEQPDFDRRPAALRVEGVAEWVAEMDAQAELLQAQAVELATQAMLDKEQANRDARDAEIKAIEQLRQWAQANGSERTRRLISGGFDGWHAAAEADYDAACTDAGRVVLDAMIEATGWIEAGDSEDGYTVSGKVDEKRSPSLAEMDALDAVLPFLGPNVSAELIHVTYTPNDDSEDYEEGSEEFSRTEIRVTVNTEFGEWGGFLMSPEFAREEVL